jgi:hypothetical protein
MPSSLNVRIEQTGVGVSDWIILGSGSAGGTGANKIACQVEASASATVTIEVTCCAALKLPGDTVPAEQIHPVPNLTNLTAKDLKGIDMPIKAVRINQTAGSGTSALTILQPHAYGGG